MQDRSEIDGRLHRMEAARATPPQLPPVGLENRIRHRMGELARLLSNPANIGKVRAELQRLANG